MDHRDQMLRTTMLYLSSPAVLAAIAAVVVMRPLTAYQDHFRGPEGMWYDLKQWARTGELYFPNWHRAARDHLRRHRAS